MAKIFSVSNANELMDALASATGGDVIEMAGGDYGKLVLMDGKAGFDVTFDSEVIIRSVDAEQLASFSGLDLRGVSNLTFDRILFDYKFSSNDPVHIRPFSITDESSYIKIKDSIFDGDLANGISDEADGYGYGYGLNIRDTSYISVDNNEFFDWHRGAVFSSSDNLVVTGNEVYSIRSDGFDFVEVKSVLIEKNYIHDFKAPADTSDHRDMIQFWTSGTNTPSIDVIIRDNLLDIGNGAWTQSIFMRNEEVDLGRSGIEMFYHNILIENNTIYNGHAHGITVGETNGLIIQNNSVLQAQGGLNDLVDSISVPKINVSAESASVAIKHNVTSSINGFIDQNDWVVGNNALISPSSYVEHFVTSTLDLDSGSHSFAARPYGVIEKLGAGSTDLQFPHTAETLTALFQVYSEEGSENSLILDASWSVGPLGLITENDASFIWTFEDGSTSTGRILKHDFSTSGYHNVTLSVVTKDGASGQAQFTAGIRGSDILQFDAQLGQFEALAYGEEQALSNGDLPLLVSANGYSLQLGGEGSRAKIAKSDISSFFEADAFEISLSLKADNSFSWGEVARIHTSFTARVDVDGNFALDLFLDDGPPAKIVSKGVSLSDGSSHDVVARFDGKAGVAEIFIDGQLVATESVSGSLKGGPRSLDFGNPWGEQNFDGELSVFMLSAPSSSFTVYDGFAEVMSDGSTVPPDTTPPEANSTPPEMINSEPLPQEDSGSLAPLLLGGYELDTASLSEGGSVKLYDDAHILYTQNGHALSFDGHKDYASLGRLKQFEASQKIAFSADFKSNSVDTGSERLVWNHMKVGLSLEGDGIRVFAANNNEAFHKGFLINNLGLNDGSRHTATVLVDAEADRLQVIVDDKLVLEEQNTDFDFVGAGGNEWGWSLGTAWNRWFNGEVYDFQISDGFEFIETVAADGLVL